MQIVTRPNRFLSGLSSQLQQKVPKNLSADELNVVLGLGSASLAAAATTTLSQVAPRDMFLRDLIIQSASDAFVTSIVVSGDALLLGGNVPAAAFSPANPNRPGFDLPCKGGTTVAVTITNGVTAASFTSAAFTID
jgi:hypothetical protein